MKLDPREVATSAIVVDDPNKWLERAVLEWEAHVHEDGWDQPARMGVLILVREPVQGIGVAQIPIPERLMANPPMFLEEMAKQEPEVVRKFTMPQAWRDAGWEPMGLALTVEAWGIEQTPINLRLFRTDIEQHPNRIEIRRTLLVGPEPQHSFTLERIRGGRPKLIAGIDPEFRGMDTPPEDMLEVHLRKIARMLVSKANGGAAD